MKKPSVLFFFLISVFFLLFANSCNRAAPSGKAPVQEDAAPLTTETKTAHALRVNTGFYDIENDTGSETDIAVYKSALPLGEAMLVCSEPRKAVYQGTSYDFTKVSLDQKPDGYVISSNIAVGGTLGVVTDDNARIYKTPKNIDVTNSILSRKTILVVFPETEQNGFMEFKAYDPVLKTTFSSSYIKSASYSLYGQDIESSILLQTAQSLDPARDKVRIDALLESAAMDYPNSVFSEEIQELLYPETQAQLRTQAAAESLMYTSSDNVNVRDLPDAVLGNVLGQLAADTAVFCDKETTETFTINDMTAKWYHVTAPIEGWIFGGWLTGK